MNEVFGLNNEAWDRWVLYRKTRRKPYRTQFGMERAQKKLASFGDFQMEAVERCMEKEWVDLYPVPPTDIAKLQKVREANSLEARKIRELHRRAVEIGFRAALPHEDSTLYKMLLDRFEHQKWQKSGPRTIAELIGGGR